MKLLVVLALLLTGAIVHSDPVIPSHLIIGTWKHTLSKYNCSEVYTFRADGTVHATSGEEVAESAYEISESAGPNGFYKFVDTHTADNGKKDCTGHVTPVGLKSTQYMRFSRDGDSMMVCQAESFAACFGPLKRQRD
jgi:hypothetical protein